MLSERASLPSPHTTHHPPRHAPCARFDGVRALLNMDVMEQRKMSVGIHNARLSPGLDIHQNGFELIQHAVSLKHDDFMSNNVIESIYYPEIAKEVKARLNASKVVQPLNAKSTIRHPPSHNLHLTPPIHPTLHTLTTPHPTHPTPHTSHTIHQGDLLLPQDTTKCCSRLCE